MNGIVFFFISSGSECELCLVLLLTKLNEMSDDISLSKSGMGCEEGKCDWGDVRADGQSLDRPRGDACA